MIPQRFRLFEGWWEVGDQKTDLVTRRWPSGVSSNKSQQDVKLLLRAENYPSMAKFDLEMASMHL